MSGSVVSIQACPGTRLPMRSLDSAMLVDGGIEQDDNFSPGSSRQVLLIEEETLRELDLHPGQVKENITVSGLGLMGLPAGTRLSLGAAEIEITKPCEPCSRMDEIRDGLKALLAGRRGMLAKVVRDGVVRVGDRISILQPAEGTA